MTLRVIHAGLGGWGSNWEVHPIPRVKDVERVAVVEPFAPGLKAAQESLKLPDSMCFTDFEEALATVEADAVILTVPMEVHVPAAITALKAGKHVLVEKPFASTVAEAKEAVVVAEELGLILQVSQNYRYYPAARTAARLVREQAYGPVNTVNVDFRKFANGRPVEGNRHYKYVHPLLFDMAIHHFDLLRLVLGTEPVSVFAQDTSPSWSNFEQEASATVLVTMSDGATMSYRGSWISSGEPTLWGGDWHIECKDGEIHWTGRNDDTIKDDRVWVREIGGKEKKVELDPIGLHGRAGGLQAFVDAIRSGEEPENSGRRNLGSVALMEATAKSAASGKVEAVIDPWA